MTIEELNLKSESVAITTQNHKIKVKNYLSLDDKLKATTEIMQLSIDDNNFPTPLKTKAWSELVMIKYYTDIDIAGILSSEEETSPSELYDKFVQSGVILEVVKAIPPAELELFMSTAELTVNKFYEYRNSIKGILEAVTQDYSNLDLEATEIQKKLNDPNNLDFLKKVVDKLG
jgi:hypothetical protein